METSESSTTEIRQKLKEILIEETLLRGLSVTDISEDAHLVDDLGLDSTDVVALIFGIEEAFNISIEDEEIVECTTLKLIEEAVSRRLSEFS